MCFQSGARISTDLLEEYMIRVEKGFYESVLDPGRTPQVSEHVTQQRQISTRSEVYPIKEPESAIAGLLRKQKENWVDVDLNLTINLPQKTLWDVIVDSFENAEDEILDYVTKDLDIEVVREALRKSIKDIYSSKKQPVKNVRPQNIIPRSQD
jgi:hypothetical protein